MIPLVRFKGPVQPHVQRTTSTDRARPPTAARAPARGPHPRADPLRRPSPGSGVALDAGARRRSRSLARRRGRGLRAARRRGVHRASARRGADRARARRRSRADGAKGCRRGRRARALQPSPRPARSLALSASAWSAAERAVLARAANTDLAYGEPFGAADLRHALAPFLVRTRGVVATADRTGVHAGSTHALLVVAEVLRLDGVRRIGVEDPGHRWRTRALRASGLEIVPIPVDDEGLRVDALDDVDAVVVTPDHHFPSGVALAPGRRRALVDWAARGGRTIVEHDYDGHFRYDRPPAGTLQALAPEHVVYVGSASALLAPTLRLGWTVLPARLVEPVANRMFATVVAQPRLSQLALAELIRRGSLDRHLRRARTAYRRRRELLVAEAAAVAPGGRVSGAPGGLYVSLALPDGLDEAAILTAARRRGLALDGIGEHCDPAAATGPRPRLCRVAGADAAARARRARSLRRRRNSGRRLRRRGRHRGCGGLRGEHRAVTHEQGRARRPRLSAASVRVRERCNRRSWASRDRVEGRGGDRAR